MDRASFKEFIKRAEPSKRERGYVWHTVIGLQAVFVSRLWQIHVLEREIQELQCVFVKYLRALGFGVTNEIFAENVWFFRKALVRANYNDLKMVFMRKRSIWNYS